MKICVILENAPDCELDRTTVNVSERAIKASGEAGAVNDAIIGVLNSWTLSVGDTIRITEAG